MTSTRPEAAGDGTGRADLHSGERVVLVFVVPWCGPCRRLEPILDEVATSHRPAIRLERVRVDKNPELVEQYAVRATPTIVVVRGDNELARTVGAVSRIELDRLFAIAGSTSATSGGVGRVGNRADAALRVGAGASLVAAGVVLGPQLVLVVIGLLVLASAALTRRTARPSEPPAQVVSGSMQ